MSLPPAQTDAPATTRRLAAALLIGTLGWNIPFSAATQVLLPATIADLAPADKLHLFAVLTATGAVVGLLANIAFGACSDLTRSRWGARTPWVVGGGIGTAAMMLAAPHAGRILTLTLCWCLAITALNATVAALTAVVPDRVPAGRRAGISAVVGLAILLGNAIGVLLGAPFVERHSAGFAVLAAIAVLFPLAAVLIAPDQPNLDVPRPDRTAATFLRSLAPPRRMPDFYWALWGRLLLVLGYFMIQTFQLYLLTDYVGLTESRAAGVLAINSVLFLAAAIAGTLAAGPWSDRIRRRKPFVIAASLIAVAAGIAPLLSPTIAGMTAFAVIGGLAFGSYYSVDTALMTEVLPSAHSRAKDLGFLNIANSGGQVLAPVASTAMVALGFGFTPLFLASMLACALGAVLIMPIRTVR
ncbi:MFS family permease [Actinoplanes lutulentus]|uniref:MFS transporter n=1 Tax=Actinoplanes lutulentus TaxID=1287878 RepID=A0A327Z6H2_9ACTN|nr:MFS transporter [Actinoplanes lutulentus]MBB2943359.1 MFS family permease [Actinoplanes lutulentus]RAK28417.1 MFS transporter [Actinoplanes lutulentus]